MIVRSAQPIDRSSMTTLAARIGLFPPEELASVTEMIDAYLVGTADPGDRWLVAEDDGRGIAGLAYVAPERMTVGTWNVYLIAVDPERQRSGVGATLLREIERLLADAGARLLLVETSGMDGFAAQRAFYRRCGYEEEACIREFYNAGDDKIVFRKKLSPGQNPNM